MLKKKIIFSIIINLSFSSFGVHLPVIKKVDQERIKEIKLSISRKMKFHLAMRLIVPVGVTAGALYFIYNTFLGGSSAIPGQGLANTNQKPSVELRLNSLENNMIKLKKMINPSLFSYCWFKNQASNLVNYVTFGTIISAGELVCKKFFHNDNIEWFVKENIKAAMLREEIKLYAKKMKTAVNMTDKQLCYYSSAITSACRRLIIQVEFVAAFMEYQLEKFKDRSVFIKDDELLQVPHLISSANDFVKSVQKLFLTKKDVKNIAVLKKQTEKLLEFALDFELQVKRFSDIEDDFEFRFIGG